MSSPTRPDFTRAQARDLVRELFGLRVEARELVAYDDQNFRLEHDSGRRLVLKIARSSESRESLDFQNRAMEHVAAGAGAVRVPRVCSTLDGAAITEVERGGATHLVRLLTYLEGTPWSAGAPHAPDLGYRLGGAAGEVARSLAGFSHPAMDGRHEWDLRHTLDLRRRLDELPGGERELAARVIDGFERRVEPRWGALRAGVIHGDVNNDNTLVSDSGDEIAGIIDFGDVVRSATVGEAAIAMAYAMLGHRRPLAMGAEVLRGFHRVWPLEAVEIDVLPDLVLARLAASFVHSFHHGRREPNNAYLTVNQAPAGRLLRDLVDRRDLRQRFAQICGAGTVVHGGRGVDEILAARRRHLGPSLSIAYREPLKIVRGAGPFLIDHRGRAFLDGVNNVCHVGHCHPRVVAAAGDQNAKLNTNTRYLHDLLVEYAERLTATLPEALSVCYFVNSGSEANDLALRLARAHTGHRDAVVVDGAYHGTTISVVELSPYKFDGPGGAGRAPWVHQVPVPDVYRGRFKADDPHPGISYARDVAEAIERAHGAGRKIAAWFCESMLSCGGQVILPPGYLREVFRSVRAAGGVCVMDEVQVGFGRPGSHFWAFETQGVVPDVVTLGKPIGNGHPVSAVVTTRQIADSFAGGMEYFNTFGGNPVSCAVGLAVLDVVEEEGLQDNARVVGEHLLAGLRGLTARHELIGDVRGHGLFLGVELVGDRETLEPAREEATAVIEGAKERGVLLSTEGPHHNVIKIKPPIVWTKAHADLLVEALDGALLEVGSEFPGR